MIIGWPVVGMLWLHLHSGKAWHGVSMAASVIRLAFLCKTYVQVSVTSVCLSDAASVLMLQSRDHRGVTHLFRQPRRLDVAYSSLVILVLVILLGHTGPNFKKSSKGKVLNGFMRHISFRTSSLCVW